MGSLNDPIPVREAFIVLKSKLEDIMWQEAYSIAWIGASNPKAVIRTINTRAEVFGYDHPAIEAMCDHLAFLLGHGLGPEFEKPSDAGLRVLAEHDRIEYAKLAIRQVRDNVQRPLS